MTGANFLGQLVTFLSSVSFHVFKNHASHFGITWSLDIQSQTFIFIFFLFDETLIMTMLNYYDPDYYDSFSQGHN